jgi:GTP cyclohydrolase II
MNLDEATMSFAPNVIEMLARARADLRMGVPVVLNSANPVVMFSVETLSPRRLAQITALNAPAVLVLTAQRAHTLKTPAYDGDLARILLPKSVDIAWITALANPADDLSAPMKGPLQCQRAGDAGAHRAAIKLIKSAQLLPAALVVPITAAQNFAEANTLTMLDLAAAHVHLAALSPLHAVIDAALPTTVSDRGRLHVFRPENGSEEHYAIEIGRPQRSKPVLARLHSACFTGDLLGSLKCDCGPQLRAALAHMGARGAGVLLYLNQEGRGIGLTNKMRAYSLQDQGFDTVEANHRLGFEDDERDFRIGSEILKSLGFTQVQLLTNNPKKIEMMTACGLSVHERVPLIVGENPHNREYLATKAQKSGHLL